MNSKEVMALNNDTIHSHLIDAYKEYRRYKQSAIAKRQHWLEELADSKAKEEALTKVAPQDEHASKDSTVSSHLKQLINREKTRRIFRKINFSVGKGRMAGVSLIQTLNSVGEWQDVTDPQSLVRALIEEYKQKYHQTESTPPMRYPVLPFLGYLGINHNSLNLLNGRTQTIPHIDAYSARLFTKLSKIPQYEPIPIGISTKDYRQGWQKSKERTSSGGSLLHFGHCKAISQDESLSAMEASLMSIPLRSGYAFSHWRRGIDCTLLKKKNSFQVNKLRTIVLFEADFNFINKSVSYKLAQIAEKK